MEKIAFWQSQKVKIRSIVIFKIGKNFKPKVDLTVRNLPWAQKSLTLLKKRENFDEKRNSRTQKVQ